MGIDLSPLVGTSYENLQEFLYFLINYAITISAVVAVVSLIISGFKYILSFGDDKKVKAATSSIIYSLVGLVLVFAAPIVIKFVINTLLK